MPRDPLVNFWVHVMAMMEYHPSFSVPNGPRLTDEIVEKLFVLTPLAADGFVEETFSFLAPDELNALKSAVAGVRAVTSQMGKRTSATPEEKSRALPHFQKIISILAPDRYADPEAFRIGKQVERRLVPSPPHLDHLRFMTGRDSTDDPALWIWAYTKEKDSGEYDQEAFFAAVDEIDSILKEVAEEVAPDRWPYISYRSTLDQLEYEAAA